MKTPKRSPKNVEKPCCAEAASRCPPEILKEVLEEERLYERVRRRLDSIGVAAELPNYDAQLVQLRDAVAEEKLNEDQASLFEEMDRLAAISRIRSRWPREKIDNQSPYFAHLGLLTDQGERRDILLGKKTFICKDVRIVDWRHAPVSGIYYRYREGDAFVEEFARRQVSGQVEKRRAVTIVDRQLVRVATSQAVFLRTTEGWKDASFQTACLHGGAGKSARPDTTSKWPGKVESASDGSALLLGTRDQNLVHRADKRLPEIVSLLDTEQFDLLTLSGDKMLVVSGGAGCGKTTVGLHRLAYLAYQDTAEYRPSRMQVIVFSTALKRYISIVLPALGLKGVAVTTLTDWALAQCRRHFKGGMSKRTCDDTPAVVVRFKTHVGLLHMLKEATEKASTRDPVALFDDLFTDRYWISQGLQRYAPGVFSQKEMAQIHRWCTDQQFRRADGPNPEFEENLPCYDEEDAMILLRIHQLLNGRLMYAKKRKLAYDHLMVDEAQDFSPLELAVLLQTVPKGSVTLAGDAAQKITDNEFSDWSEMLAAIGQDRFEISQLGVNYRSTSEIMEVARAVLGPLASDEPWQASRSGLPVELLGFASQGEAMTFLTDSLSDLILREPSASIAVLAPNDRLADEAFGALDRAELDFLHRVRNDDFSFGSGVEVTDVASTKGLEFDYVIMLHVDAESYPDTQAARRLLHVGCSRAIHQLWLMAWNVQSPLLPKWLEPRVAGMSSSTFGGS